MNRAADSRRVFTPKQGQYLAFIHAYTLLNGRPPAEADMMVGLAQKVRWTLNHRH